MGRAADLNVSLVCVQLKQMGWRERRLLNCLYYQLELSCHQFDPVKTLLYMKTRLDASTCNKILDDVSPGLMDKLTPTCVKDILKKAKENSFFSKIVFLKKIVVGMGFAFLDFGGSSPGVIDRFVLGTLLLLPLCRG